MGTIITKELSVESNKPDNPITTATYICCDCGPAPTSWLMFVVGDHNHLQCCNCNTSYCNGRCEEQ